MSDYLEFDLALAASPGRSYDRALGRASIPWDGTICHEFANTRLIRTDRWKLTRRQPDGPDELYEMVEDPGERVNRFEVVADLSEDLNAFFDRYADPAFDLR